MKPIIVFATVATLVIGVCMLISLMNQPPNSNAPPSPPSPQRAVAKHDAVIYVLDPGGRKLKPVSVSLRADATLEEGAAAIMEEIIRFSDEHANADAAPVPFGTRLKRLTVDGDLVVLDFNQEFRDTNFWGGSEHEHLALRALVNSLTELPGVKRVQIKVNGAKVESLGGHEEVSEPLQRDESTLPEVTTGTGGKSHEKSS